MRRSAVSNDLPMLGVFIIAVVAVSVLGGLATADAIPGWYATLAKPSWTPPNWVFGPAWTTLYVLMAVAAWLVWRRRRLVEVRGALLAWWVQLALNLLWTMLFFGLRQPVWGLIEIVALWIAIAITIALFHRVRPLAALLLVPYIAWVSFAISLNAGIVALQ
jgi:benzodiazapine receptor